MMFIKKLVDHLLNQVLVDTLANSRVFQKFAVWSHKAAKDIGEKGKVHGGLLDEQLLKFRDIAKERSAQFRKEFEEELKKIQQQQNQSKR